MITEKKFLEAVKIVHEYKNQVSGIIAGDLKAIDESLEYKNMQDFLTQKLVEFELSTRTLFAMKSVNIETVADLLNFPKRNLLKIRGLGKLSRKELEDFVLTKGLFFGMNLAKYGL